MILGKWVLVLTILSPVNNSQSNLAIPGFESKQACETAKAIYYNQFTKMKTIDPDHTFICLYQGDPK